MNSFHRIISKVPSALSFGSREPFLTSYQNCYVFSASLSKANSTFINSPLIVPTFYNIAERSLKNPELYEIIGENTTVDVDAEGVGQDNIIKLAGTENEFIPLQQTFSKKVSLRFEEYPQKEGLYAVLQENDTLRNLSFNYPRNESTLEYLPTDALIDATIFDGIPDLFEELQEDTAITAYWKWFVIFALLFAVLELAIQKWLP